jgi:CheY-like chemotaxis protein
MEAKRSTTVLVVEDDPDIRQAMADLIRDDGYECLFAGNGLEALETLQRTKPSLILADLLMPVMDGVELLARLRRDPEYHSIPVVVMTAATDRLVGLSLDSLDVPLLRKPIDAEALTQLLARQSQIAGADPEPT